MGSPDISNMKPFELLFEALAQMEWGDLIREAAFYVRNQLVDPANNSSELSGDTIPFGVWQPKKGLSIAHSMDLRARIRFETARSALDTMRQSEIS